MTNVLEDSACPEILVLYQSLPSCQFLKPPSRNSMNNLQKMTEINYRRRVLNLYELRRILSDAGADTNVFNIPYENVPPRTQPRAPPLPPRNPRPFFAPRHHYFLGH
uniref:Uncharacterized protein n=1 Tax=Lutzomyia longipalpis TaxID=7200 RepID=A0A1B0CIA6_LUTLO